MVCKNSILSLIVVTSCLNLSAMHKDNDDLSVTSHESIITSHEKSEFTPEQHISFAHAMKHSPKDALAFLKNTKNFDVSTYKEPLSFRVASMSNYKETADTYYDLFSLLIEKGLDPNYYFIDPYSKDLGASFLTCAHIIDQCRFCFNKEKSDAPMLIKLLLEKGADPDLPIYTMPSLDLPVEVSPAFCHLTESVFNPLNDEHFNETTRLFAKIIHELVTSKRTKK